MFASDYNDTNVGIFQYCSVCGQINYGSERNLHCLQCDKAICINCSQYGFCPPDFAQLKREQQKLLIQTDHNFQQFQNRITSLTITVRFLLILAFIVILSGIFGEIDEVFEIGFILMISIIWSGILAWIILRKIENDNFKGILSEAVLDMLQND